MTMPPGCNSCSSTYCCVTWGPWVPVEIDYPSSGYARRMKARDGDPNYLVYWMSPLRVRARALARTRRNRY